jgi:hypothetical protein
MVFDSKRERVLTKNERVELRHFLQVLMEHSRTVRNAIEPDSGRLRITAEAWADQWLALRKDLDALTEQILPGSTVRRVRLPVRRETAVVEREAAVIGVLENVPSLAMPGRPEAASGWLTAYEVTCLVFDQAKPSRSLTARVVQTLRMLENGGRVLRVPGETTPLARWALAKKA